MTSLSNLQLIIHLASSVASSWGPRASQPQITFLAQKTQKPKTTCSETNVVNTEIPLSVPSNGNSNSLFAAVWNLNAPLTALHAALSFHTMLLLFSGKSDSCSMSAHATHRADSRVNQDQRHRNESSSSAAAGTCGSAVG